jgi:hypothetical protein
MDIDTEKTAVWKLFFLVGGFVSLFIWNSLLNLVDYFEKALEPNSFSLIAFVFFFGHVASILTASIVFRGYRITTSLNVALGCILFGFFVLIYFVEFTYNTETNKICVLFTSFFIGYISAYFQSKTFALAAQCSMEELLYVSFGTGLAGVLTNLFSFFVSLVYPTNDDNEVLSILRRQVLVYLLMTVIAFIAYLVIQHEFQVMYKDLVEKCEEGERELEHAFSDVISYDTRKAEDEWKILRTIGSLLLSTLFLYTVTLLFVVYFNVKCYFAFDDNRNAFNIASYMFFFNVFDTIGKILPPSLTFKSEVGVWAVNLLRLGSLAHLFLVLTGVYGDSWATPTIRIIINCVLGFTNGMLTNSVQAQVANRFRTRNEKAKAEYLVVLFLLTGVGIGALLGVVFNDLHLGLT